MSEIKFQTGVFFLKLLKRMSSCLSQLKNDINQAHTKRLGNKAKLHLDAKSKP